MEVELRKDKNGRRMNVDKALRILKKKTDREGIIKEVRKRKYYEKPSDKKYRKQKRAKYIARLIAEEDRDWA